MAQFIRLRDSGLEKLRDVDKCLVSYNVEMTEVTGGTFWKAYTPEQVDGTEKFAISPSEMADLHQWYDPIDTTNPRLIKLAKELGTAWVRVSGTWATKTYYDFEGTGIAPEGYQNLLTKEKWHNLINFVDAVGGKLLISVANCQGLHRADEPWNPSQAEKIFKLSEELGHPIDAVEFTNEPNLMCVSGFPEGYTAADFRRDQDLFHRWVRENYPNCIIVGPCTTSPETGKTDPNDSKGGSGIADIMPACSTADLLDGCTEKIDIFSYHYYNGISERLEMVMPSAHWPAEDAHTDAYLAMAGHVAQNYVPLRDKYVPGSPMWVTESGDAGGGGDTWASTYLDVLRTLNELGAFSYVTDGIIFHNTLASSDYGYLQHGTFEPRPNYFAVKLWNTLMGTEVFECGNPDKEGAHVYCHSRRDGKKGVTYLVINNSLTDATTVELPKDAEVYTLAGKTGIRSRIMTLNGRDLVLGENDELPDLSGNHVTAGTLELAPGTCTFIVL